MAFDTRHRNLTESEWEALDWPPAPERKPPGYVAYDWKEEHDRFMDRHYWHIPKKVICEKLKVAPTTLNSYITRLKSKGLMKRKKVNPTSFKKGLKPWNKGMKGLACGGMETRFKKGQAPQNAYPVGTIKLVHDKMTHVIKYAKGKRKWKYLSRYIWEQEHGPIPKGHVIRFKDGDTQNYSLDNLECISRSEHSRRNSLSDGVISVWLSLQGKKGKGSINKGLQKTLLTTKEGMELIRMKRNSHMLKQALEEANG